MPDASSPACSTADRFRRDPLLVGTCCGLASAVAYTAANACLTAVSGGDPVWISCVKAFPAVVLFGPTLLHRLARGTETLPPRRQLAALLTAALLGSALGNIVFQWSLGVIGMALTVPLTLGTLILGGALLGRIFLHEPITPRMLLSTMVLIAAVLTLSLGAGEASRAVARSLAPPSLWLTVAGVAGGCFAGLAYAALGVVIRHAVNDRTSVSMSIVVVTSAGVIALGMVSLSRIGLSGMLGTLPRDFWTMVLAGVFNAVAFMALAKSLQLIPVIYVNSLNATQATMSAVTGVWLFAEPPSPTLWAGVILTAAGLVLMQRRRPRGRTVARQPDARTR